ncbi:MAG: HAMP domain-containing histidine kinase [Thermomicrobiales bacterium]|nr:HAMP domain-containing histidine kinase [Thermomicrobiales bacterium]
MTALLAPFRLLGWPFRLYRRNISIQLITSHVLVVMLTAIVIETLAAITVFVGLTLFLRDNYTDFASVDVAQSVAVSLRNDPLTERLALGEAALSVGDKQRLQSIVDGVINSRESPTSIGITTRVESALITDPSGTVVATSDPSWVVNSPVSGTSPISELAERLVARIIELNGSPSDYGELYVIDSIDSITVAAYPILDGQRLVGVVAMRSTFSTTPTIRNIIQQPGLFATLAIANAVLFALILIPTLIVAVPVGIWRARRVSKRIEALTKTATAMVAGDRATQVAVTGQDEIAQLGQRFNDMLAHLDRADRERKAFVANVSHDLRTPIAIIQGRVEQMLQDESGQVDPETRRALEVVHSETTTLSRLIDDLFTLARLEETSLPMSPEAVDIAALAAQMASAIQPVAWSQQRVSVQSVVKVGLPPALADATRLRQILGNLLYNALRHTPEGGLVVIDAEAIGETVEVRVSDTGIGMTSEELGHVFERFYQVEQRHRSHDGSGLGLSIVKDLTEAQGGSVAVESTPGQGTTFRVRLPMARVTPNQQ